MNWHRVSKIIFPLAVVYQLLLQAQPSIAHSGHQHEPEQKSVGQPPSETIPVAPEQPQILPSPPVIVAPVSEVNHQIQLLSSPHSLRRSCFGMRLSWLLQPGELLFLLLVTGPFGLFYLKHMLYKRE